jgi:hypothetical protein
MTKRLINITTIALAFIILRAQPCNEIDICGNGTISIEISGKAPLINNNGIRIFAWDL